MSLVAALQPVDEIWRAVLAQDDAALAAIDPASGPVWLLVHRGADGVEVTRLDAAAWQFSSQLFESRPLQALVDAQPRVDQSALLAGHIAAGRLCDFLLHMDAGARGAPEETPT